MDFGIVQFTSDRGLMPHILAPLIENAGFASYYVPRARTHPPLVATPRIRRPVTRPCPTIGT